MYSLKVYSRYIEGILKEYWRYTFEYLPKVQWRKQETDKNIICFFWDWCYHTCLYSMSCFIVIVEMYHGGYYMKRQKRFFDNMSIINGFYIIFALAKRFFFVAASNQYLFTIFMVPFDVMLILCIVLCTALFV